MQSPHNREHREHLCGDTRVTPPVLSSKGDLANVLPRAEAVIHSASTKALLPEMGVNPTAEVRLKMWTYLPSTFCDRKVSRGNERWRNTAEAKTVCAVSMEAEANS